MWFAFLFYYSSSLKLKYIRSIFGASEEFFYENNQSGYFDIDYTIFRDINQSAVLIRSSTPLTITNSAFLRCTTPFHEGFILHSNIRSSIPHGGAVNAATNKFTFSSNVVFDCFVINGIGNSLSIAPYSSGATNFLIERSVITKCQGSNSSAVFFLSSTGNSWYYQVASFSSFNSSSNSVPGELAIGYVSGASSISFRMSIFADNVDRNGTDFAMLYIVNSSNLVFQDLLFKSNHILGNTPLICLQRSKLFYDNVQLINNILPKYSLGYLIWDENTNISGNGLIIYGSSLNTETKNGLCGLGLQLHSLLNESNGGIKIMDNQQSPPKAPLLPLPPAVSFPNGIGLPNIGYVGEGGDDSSKDSKSKNSVALIVVIVILSIIILLLSALLVYCLFCRKTPKMFADRSKSSSKELRTCSDSESQLSAKVPKLASAPPPTMPKKEKESVSDFDDMTFTDENMDYNDPFAGQNQLEEVVSFDFE